MGDFGLGADGAADGEASVEEGTDDPDGYVAVCSGDEHFRWGGNGGHD